MKGLQLNRKKRNKLIEDRQDKVSFIYLKCQSLETPVPSFLEQIHNRINKQKETKPNHKM